MDGTRRPMWIRCKKAEVRDIVNLLLYFFVCSIVLFNRMGRYSDRIGRYSDRIADTPRSGLIVLFDRMHVECHTWTGLVVTLKSVPMRSALLSVSNRTKIEPARHDNIPPSTIGELAFARATGQHRFGFL